MTVLVSSSVLAVVLIADHHEWLLSGEVDVLPRLLLPLVGSEDKFSDAEMDQLPVDLQYPEPSKQREPDPDIRRMLVEAINQVHACCALNHGHKQYADRIW